MGVEINRVGDQGPRGPWAAMVRGFRLRCPNCGTGRLFARYLRTSEACESCGEAFHHHRADDMPPYLTIFVVGHIVVPLILYVEKTEAPAMWVHMALWPTLAAIMSLVLLPMIKGAVVGLQWALRMHGFGGASERE